MAQRDAAETRSQQEFKSENIVYLSKLTRTIRYFIICFHLIRTTYTETRVRRIILWWWSTWCRIFYCLFDLHGWYKMLYKAGMCFTKQEDLHWRSVGYLCPHPEIFLAYIFCISLIQAAKQNYIKLLEARGLSLKGILSTIRTGIWNLSI